MRKNKIFRHIEFVSLLLKAIRRRHKTVCGGLLLFLALSFVTEVREASKGFPLRRRGAMSRPLLLSKADFQLPHIPA